MFVCLFVCLLKPGHRSGSAASVWCNVYLLQSQTSQQSRYDDQSHISSKLVSVD